MSNRYFGFTIHVLAHISNRRYLRYYLKIVVWKNCGFSCVANVAAISLILSEQPISETYLSGFPCIFRVLKTKDVW